jgi:hypothetical protein
MRIFLSGLDNNIYPQLEHLDAKHEKIKSGLSSFYYLSKNTTKSVPHLFEDVIRRCDEMLIDSGAHSFQKGVNVDWDTYTDAYAKWIAQHDRPDIRGYFEMDVDNIIGYNYVLKLRKKLLTVTDKIIPVWHKNRGIEDFKRMCHETKGDVIAITGFRNEDIRDGQYPAFVNYAHKAGKKVHCLGMTRMSVLRKVPFDYVDSSSWKQGGMYGNLLYFKDGRIITRNVAGKYTTNELMTVGLDSYMEAVRYFNAKWAHINHDLYKFWQFVISCLSHKTKEFQLWGTNNAI